MKLLKKISLLSALSVIALAVTLPLTSCGAAYTIKPKAANLGLMESGATYDQLPSITPTIKDLLYGDCNYSNGDYVLFIGSTADLATNKFLFNSIDNNPNYNTWTNAAFYNGIKTIDGYKLPEHISFSFYLDVAPVGDEGALTPLATYSSGEIDEEDEESKIKEGDYKRNDASAKEFREIWFFIKDLYAPAEMAETGDSIIIAFNDGKATFSKTPEKTDTFLEWINGVYNIKI